MKNYDWQTAGVIGDISEHAIKRIRFLFCFLVLGFKLGGFASFSFGI